MQRALRWSRKGVACPMHPGQRRCTCATPLRRDGSHQTQKAGPVPATSRAREPVHQALKIPCVSFFEPLQKDLIDQSGPIDCRAVEAPAVEAGDNGSVKTDFEGLSLRGFHECIAGAL